MTGAAVVLGLVLAMVLMAWRAGRKEERAVVNESRIEKFNRVFAALHRVRSDDSKRDRLRKKYARK